MNHPVFKKHGREFENNLYTYPVISRRSKGLSLGVNLSFRKECNFDCVYCQVDRTTKNEKEKFVDISKFKIEIIELIEMGLSGELFDHPRFQDVPEEYKNLSDIAFSGDGEPTTSKYFEACSKIVENLIVEYKKKNIHIKPIVITNASAFQRKFVFDILINFYNLGGGPWVKLDAGEEEEYKKIAETSVPFSQILNNINQLGKEIPLTLQTIIYKYSDDKFSFSPDKMIGCLNNLQSKKTNFKTIQLYTLARSTRLKDLKPLSTEELESIGLLIEKNTSIKVDTYS